jgi:hypothetical protein
MKLVVQWKVPLPRRTFHFFYLSPTNRPALPHGGPKKAWHVFNYRAFANSQNTLKIQVLLCSYRDNILDNYQFTAIVKYQTVILSLTMKGYDK